VILLTTYAEAKEAFRSRDLRQALYDEGDRLMHGVIVNLHGDEHVARRRLENRLFRRDTFAWYERDRIPEIIAEVLRGPIAAGRGELLALARRTMMTLSIDVAGVDVDPERFDEFYELMDRLARASTVAHATGDQAAIVERGDRALASFDERFFAPSFSRRSELVDRWGRGELADEELPRDVLTTLLRNQDRLDLPRATVLREVAYFPWVGSHSTSAQLLHAMHHVFEWLAVHSDDRERVEHEDVLRQRFVHESMRLHPASPVAVRTAVDEVVLRSGRVIAEGERVVISTEQANRDPAVFGDDADVFDPGRTLPEGVPPWGLSFGHGPHACLGQELAGGIEPDDAVEHHLLGSVALMAGVMLAAGARPDPHDRPTLDSSTTRTVWGRYPVLFDPPR
jgi:cytochrome P450